MNKHRIMELYKERSIHKTENEEERNMDLISLTFNLIDIEPCFVYWWIIFLFVREPFDSPSLAVYWQDFLWNLQIMSYVS